MPARNKIIRILKFLGKALLGLLILLFSIILLLHLPFVQRKITQRLATFLSSKMEARVDIKSIEFSMFGSVAIDSLQVWDRDNNEILSLGNLEVTTYIFNLLSGDYIIDDIHIKDFSGKLIQDEGGLNIQYILDAFQSKETGTVPVDTLPTEIKLQFRNIILENISFEYKSNVDGMDIVANLGKFTSENAEFSTGPNNIRVDRLHLQRAAVHILSAQQPDTVLVVIDSTINNYFNTDFGIGMGIEVNKLEIDESDFSYHVGQVIDPPKFDPSHITLKAIQLAVSDILIREDTLSVGLQNLSVQTPGFIVSNVKADAHMNRNRLNLEGFQFTSNENNLEANLTAEYNDDSNEIKKLPDLEITVKGLINPNDFAYFLDDTLMKNFNGWKTTDITLEANYVKGTGEIKSLNVKTENSNLQANGKLSDVADMDKFSWNDFVINTSIGADFNQILKPYASDLKLPPDIKIQLTSTGNPKKIFVDGTVITTWGELYAKGETTLLTDNIGLDIHLNGNHVQPGKWIDLPWLGPIDFSTDAKGTIGKEQDLAVKGQITSIVMMNEPIHDITFQSQLGHENVKADISIADPNYLAKVHGNISFGGPMKINVEGQLDKFKLGDLLERDSTLSVTGTFTSNMIIDTASMEGHVKVNNLYISKQGIKDDVDSLSIDALISPKGSQIDYVTKNGKGSVTANFDLRDMSTILQSMPNTIFGFANREFYPGKGRTLQFQLQMDDPRILMMAGIDIKDFSSIGIRGDWDEQKRTINMEANSAKFKGYGIALDTLHIFINSAGDSITAGTMVRNIIYNTTEVGDIDMNIKIKGDTAISHLLVSKDSVSLLVFGAHMMNKDSGLYVYPGQLHLYGLDFSMDPDNPVLIHNGNIMLKNFLITRDKMETSLNGDLHAFNMNFKNLDLKNLNAVMFPDSAVITNGYFNGMISYEPGHHLDLVANIDSLSLYHSLPLTIAVTAKKEENVIPFQFLMSNASNKVDVHGQYMLNDNQVDATLVLDVSNPELFSIVFAGVLDSIKGGIKGEATIRGPLDKPDIRGYIGFHDFGMTTTRPRMVLSVRDDKIRFDSSGILLDHFTLYDQQQHPLTISGYLHSRDYKSYAYDLKIKTDQYALVDNPESANVPLTGLMMIGTDVHLSGNEKDKQLDANVTVKDTTSLVYTFPNDKNDLLNTFGIVEFVDPEHLMDTTVNEQSGYYDSLVASLPDIKLNAKIKIEEKAKLRVVTDQQSGDFFEASGSADLELGYDRTGNPRLVGNYTIKQGVYRMSFYDLVKKTFTLVPGSSITWSGSPESGDINIKATHTVATNSLGLVGHEIGESEKSVYKRTLDYEVGININGTIEKPIITFSLDLPEQDKASYPLLANKLDRLRLPEFQTELNKQVFGLLVLGGFLPETSVGDIDQSQIATTAVYNSINAILATQLNRFASQHVKGVSIDVGIQSYADYSTPGGKTQTAMDFRVSKSVFNDRLSFEVGGDFDINSDQSGANTGDNYRGDVAIIYDLTGNGDKQLKLFNNESYDIIYQEIRNTGISLIFIREFDRGDKAKAEAEAKDKDKAEEKSNNK